MDARLIDGRRPRRPGAVDAQGLDALIADAVRTYRDELSGLGVLAERRYDRSAFPTVGQYDWASGQVLYALVRHSKPRVVVEFSTSSGYSTSFTALALGRNGRGRLHSVDIDGSAQAAAGRWLAQMGVRDVVELHLGDCRDVLPRLIGPEVDVLFVDTLHSFGIAEWYLRDVVPRLRPDALVHVHDVMPAEARVRIHGGPPFGPEGRPPRPPTTHLVKRFFWLLLHRRWPNPFPDRPPRETLPLARLDVHAPTAPDELPTIDGNYFEEAVLLRQLLREADPSEVVYLHRLVGELDVLAPQRYAHLDEMQRTDAKGAPLEWNDALWCRAAALQRLAAPGRVRDCLRSVRARYYGRRVGDTGP